MRQHNLPFCVCLGSRAHNVGLCLPCVKRQKGNALPQVREQCCSHVRGRPPSLSRVKIGDLNVQLEGFLTLAKSNSVCLSQRTGPSSGPEPPGAEGGRRVERREKNNSISVRTKMSPKEGIHQRATSRLLSSSPLAPVLP